MRRSSMREKAAISWKEAVEEGRRFRHSSASSNEDEEEATNGEAAEVVRLLSIDLLTV